MAFGGSFLRESWWMPPETTHVFLIPGFFGFANFGQVVYFAHVREYLRDRFEAAGIPAEIHRVSTPPTAALSTRAELLCRAIAAIPGDGPVHLIGHSSGALDARLVAAPTAGNHEHEVVSRRVKTVLSICGPHAGTPLAAFFEGFAGGALLQLLSIMTIVVLRFGHLPLSALIGLSNVLTGARDRGGVPENLLEQLHQQLLSELSPERREELTSFLAQVAADRRLLPELKPESMASFDRAVIDAPEVRHGAVVCWARAPSIITHITSGFDAYAQVAALLYQLLWTVAAGTPPELLPVPDEAQSAALMKAFGEVPPATANDGIVPTLSQVRGEIVHAARADHLDVIGHFHAPDDHPPHVDWIHTGSGFHRRAFDALWHDVARWLMKTP